MAVPITVNLVTNLLFIPIFAGLRNVPLAAADILVVWGSLIWCIVLLGSGGAVPILGMDHGRHLVAIGNHSLELARELPKLFSAAGASQGISS